MELRRLLICSAFFLTVVISCSEARYSMHSLHRRQANDDEVNYDDELQQADEATDDETQNDTDNGGTSDTPKTPPAMIITNATVYQAKSGDNLILECMVSPYGTVVQWYKDNELYFMGSFKVQTNASRYTIINDSHNLEIKQVVPEDRGVYRCEVISDKPSSINHTVVVQESPKIRRFEATNKGQVLEGTDLLLTCDVTGLPAPNIVWSKGGIDGNQRLTEKDGEFSPNSVFIKGVKKEQSGKYYCYAFNTLGASQADVDIVIVGKPRVHVHKTIVNSAVNVEAVLQCSVHEENNVHMRWYKDGLLVDKNSARFKINEQGPHSNLTVIPASSDDFGIFTCEAENEHGKHNKSIELVQHPVLEDIEVDGAKISWRIHSHDPLEQIEIQVKDMSEKEDWKVFSAPIPQAQEHNYEISYNLEEQQLQPGKYMAVVKAKNTHSWSSNSDPIEVEIEARPQYIQHASVFRGNSAHSISSSSVVVSTILMYLLVRMF